MSGDELRTHYHDSLDALRSELIRLGAMTAETVGMGTAVLLDRDLAGAQRLIDGDDVIDELSLELEEECFRLLALQAPMAGELRQLLTTLRVISELERSAAMLGVAPHAGRGALRVSVFRSRVEEPRPTDRDLVALAHRMTVARVDRIVVDVDAVDAARVHQQVAPVGEQLHLQMAS